ncbi:MAG: integrin alpha [Pseudomonadota bacterium]
MPTDWPLSRRGANDRDRLAGDVQRSIRRLYAPRLSLLLMSSALLALPPATYAQAFPARFELRSLFPPAGGDGSEGFVIVGASNFDDLSVVTAAGDVNGDGIGDLVAGASGAQAGAGEAYVIYGSQAGFPPLLDIGLLVSGQAGEGQTGTVLQGTQTGDLTGAAVASAGDVNGDGLDDLLIGASGAANRSGRVYVVFGRSGGLGATFPLEQLTPEAGGDGTLGLVVEGIDTGDVAGSAVGSVGDLNGDGHGDFAIGASNAGDTPSAGESYVIFGRPNDTVFPPRLNLAELLPEAGGDGSDGIVLTSPSIGNTVSGVGRAGDLNADGIDDMWIAAPRRGNPEGPGVYVVFGDDSSLAPRVDLSALNGDDGVRIDGTSVSAYTGISAGVADIGDFNGDGIDDLVIGESSGGGGSGRAFLVFGRDDGFPSRVALTDLTPPGGANGTRGVLYVGATPREAAGASVASVGDVNQDGWPDLLIGASGADRFGAENVGRAYLVYGPSAPMLATFPLGRLFARAGGDGSEGAVFNGVDEQNVAGVFSSGVGDINGDGIDDFAISTSAFYSALNRIAAGEAYVVFGQADTPRSPSE